MAAASGKKRDSLQVEGMSCRSCARTVAEALSAVNGVREAEVDQRSEKALVTYAGERVAARKHKQAVEETGYRLVV